METKRPSFFERLRDRLLPKMPDFLAMLAEQSTRVFHTTSLLVDFMETGAATLSAQIVQEEHDQDALKIRNLQLLNEAFATPVDPAGTIDIQMPHLGFDDHKADDAASAGLLRNRHSHGLKAFVVVGLFQRGPGFFNVVRGAIWAKERIDHVTYGGGIEQVRAADSILANEEVADGGSLGRGFLCWCCFGRCGCLLGQT